MNGARLRAALVVALVGLGCAGSAGRAVPPTAAAVVEGFVSDPTGDPIEGAQVFIADETVGTLSDERGAYRIELPAPGSYLIKAVRSGFTRDSLTVTIAAQPIVRADFVLGEAPVCQGPCFDSFGNPITCC
jgi:hypothetical protein